MSSIDAVIFDLDGVLVDSEQIWDEVREELARERGGRWHERAQADMMGMSSTEWSRYMHDAIGLAEPPEEISAEVVRRMEARYAERLPLIEGAVEAVQRLAGAFRLGVASSSNRPLIDAVLAATGLDSVFEATISSEEVDRGSRRRTCSSRRREGWASSPDDARRSRTRGTGLAQHMRPGCG